MDKEEKEELIELSMRKCKLSREAAEVYVDATLKLLDSAEIYHNLGDNISVADKETMRRSLINIYIAWMYDIELTDNTELLADTVADAIEYILKEAKR